MLPTFRQFLQTLSLILIQSQLINATICLLWPTEEAQIRQTETANMQLVQVIFMKVKKEHQYSQNVSTPKFHC